MSCLTPSNCERKRSSVIPLILFVFSMIATAPGQAQTITTFAGDGAVGFSGDGGAADLATLNFPRGMAFDSTGVFYIADAQNYRIRKVTAAGVISTIAGT